MQDVAPGRTIGGRYTLNERRLESPDGVEAWSAKDGQDDGSVIITLLPESLPTTAAIADAARRAESIQDQRLVRILEVGSTDGVSWIVEEHLPDARTLVDVVEDNPLSGEQTRTVIGEIASCLASASRRGMHHLRLTPYSVLLTADGGVKLGGLGTELAFEGEQEPAASEAELIDVSGLLAVAYYSMTTRWPMTEEVPGIMPAPRVVGGVPAPSEIATGVPADLDMLCRTVLNGQPGPVKPAQLAEEIGPWRNSVSDDIVPAPFPADSAHPEPPTGAAVPLPAPVGAVEGNAPVEVAGDEAPVVADKEVPVDEAGVLDTPAPDDAVAEAPADEDPGTIVLPAIPPQEAPADEAAAAATPATETPAGEETPASLSMSGDNAAASAAQKAGDPESSTTSTPEAVVPNSAKVSGAGVAAAAAAAASAEMPKPGPALAPGLSESAPAASKSPAKNPSPFAPPSSSVPGEKAPLGEKKPQEPEAPRPDAKAQTVAAVTAAGGEAVAKLGSFAKSAADMAQVKRQQFTERRASERAERELRSPSVSLSEIPDQTDGRQQPGPLVRLIDPNEKPGAHSGLVLALVGGISLLCVIISMFVIISSLMGDDSPKASGSSSSKAAPSSSASASPSAPAAAPQPVAIVSGKAVDPGGDGRENDEQIPRAYDGNPGTRWQSERYNSDPGWGKSATSGVGVAFKLKNPTALKKVRLTLGTAGQTGSIYVGGQAQLTGAAKVGEFSNASGTVEVDLTNAAQSPYVIVWFTKAVKESSGGYRVGLNEIVPLG